jgi:hypothetical protein
MMSNKNIKFRITKKLEENQSNFDKAMRLVDIYMQSLEAVPVEIRHIPENVWIKHFDGLISDEDAIKEIYEYIKKIPD